METWVSVNEKLPEVGVKVDLSYGFFGVKAAACDEWISNGWLTKSGIWSVRKNQHTPKNPIPSHWKYKS